MIYGKEKVKAKMKELELQGNSISTKDKGMYTILEIVLEMYERGFEFLPVDLYKSHNTKFLIEDGKGNGEGIVIKNYSFINKYGRQTWAKIVANEFKEKHAKEMGASIINSTELTEEKIINKFCTETFIEKEYLKIVNEKEGWKSQYIQMLLGRVYSEFIKEESWNFVKEFKNPKVNFKTLNSLLIKKVKETKKDLFN